MSSIFISIDQHHKLKTTRGNYKSFSIKQSILAYNGIIAYIIVLYLTGLIKYYSYAIKNSIKITIMN